MKVNNIVIVGGGSAGWISAALLIKTFPTMNITVIESPNTPVIGVGESTLADFSNYREYLGIDEKELMRATDASYKLSIKFTDFYDVNSEGFHYPFRTPWLGDTKKGLGDWLEIKAYYPETSVQDFVNCYFPNSYLFENNKFSHNELGQFEHWNPRTDVSYHFDAIKFGNWLKEKYCKPRGVKYIVDDVVDAVINEDGISSLVLASKEKVTADLFLDCTGFKSLLLEQYLKEPFTSYSSLLPNNRAWAVNLPYKDKDKELQGYTNCTALGNGWAWNIPLWSRLGAGYVYSDSYTSKEGALEEFKDYLMSNKVVIPRSSEDLENLEFKDIPMKVGIHERLWVKNVVAIGLSAGFIEPLEGNGLFNVFWNAKALCKTLNRGSFNQLDIDIFNKSMRQIFDNFAEFVALHYYLSKRSDTKYWEDIGKKEFGSSLKSVAETAPLGFKDFSDKKLLGKPLDPSLGITWIAIGMNHQVFDSIDQRLNTYNTDQAWYIDENVSSFKDKKDRWKKAAEKAPTLKTFLEEHIYNEK